MRKQKVSAVSLSLIVLLVSVIALTAFTVVAMRPVPQDLAEYISLARKNTYLDRYGQSLNVTYQNPWNIYHRIELHQLPEFLVQAFILSEDKRFYDHDGIDWLARFSALKQNLLAGKIVRGASSISEQVVRMIHPRPRTLWSRWVEGFDAFRLEQRYSKPEILEFYLNQVPYKSNRRGVVQAANYYFDRDISTLNQKEMLALAVLIRSPRWFDPVKYRHNLEIAIANLTQRLKAAPQVVNSILEQNLEIQALNMQYDFSHFIQFADSHVSEQQTSNPIHTTLDRELQSWVQKLLDNRLSRLEKFNVMNGAVLVIDHHSNEILSWVVGYAGEQERAFNKINAVLSLRQPGSTLKPLLYAMAMTKGWSAATMLDDAPLQEGVGHGMHTYRNYSRSHYGLISVREALGNSLNIPAVKTLQYVTAWQFLSLLYDMGIQSLAGHPNIYGDGLALGNGELSLFELVQAYTVLARMGDFKPLTFQQALHQGEQGERVLSEDVTSIIADILSDPAAREKEFGRDSILNFQYQTAVKTGTSSDYRDAWALGYDDKYTVGVWVGNLDYSPMQEITGSSGSALVLRAVFNELNRHRAVKPLYLSSNLVKKRICIDSGLLQSGQCETRDEWFIPGTESGSEARTAGPDIRIRKPGRGLMMAMDPRIPDDKEYFEFALNEVTDLQSVDWYINNQHVASTTEPNYYWKLQRGTFRTHAEILLKGRDQKLTTEVIEYQVN